MSILLFCTLISSSLLFQPKSPLIFCPSPSESWTRFRHLKTQPISRPLPTTDLTSATYPPSRLDILLCCLGFTCYPKSLRFFFFFHTHSLSSYKLVYTQHNQQPIHTFCLPGNPETHPGMKRSLPSLKWGYNRQ